MPDYLTTPQCNVRHLSAEIETIYRPYQVLLLNFALGERIQALELELHIELHAAGWLSGNRLSEQGRGYGPDIGHIIRMVQDIEGVQRQRDHFGFLLCLRERKVMRHVKVEINQSWARHRVSGYCYGPIVQNAIMILIATRCDVDRLSRINRQRNAQSKELDRLGRREQIELVQPVVV